jgi:hypothetical protein
MNDTKMDLKERGYQSVTDSPGFVYSPVVGSCENSKEFCHSSNYYLLKKDSG